MPCQSYGPSDFEIERDKLRALLDEVGAKYLRMRAQRIVPDNDALARLLCTWCKTHDVTKQSLELQIWWRDHQKKDAARLKAEAEARRVERLAKQAARKLTKDELAALSAKLKGR